MALKAGAEGISVDVQGRQSFSTTQKSVIQHARALNMDVHCNLTSSCFDWRGADNTHNDILDLTILVGDVADCDCTLIILHEDAQGVDIESKKETLQAINDEVLGVDCVGAPIKQRFGFSSRDASLEQWCAEVLHTKQRLKIFA
jgi:hypothetical protein